MSQKNQAPEKGNFFYNIEKSAVVSIIGIILLFSASIAVVLIAPVFVDPTWTTPTSQYQVQMYEISDPNLYISSTATRGTDLQFVYHLKKDYTLLAFEESETVRILAPKELEKYVTRFQDPVLKLTSELLMLRRADEQKSSALSRSLQEVWEKANPDYEKLGRVKPSFDVFELFRADGSEAFAVAPRDGTFENWASKDYVILDEHPMQLYHQGLGVIYINNPHEYRYSKFKFGDTVGWRFDPGGEKVADLATLRGLELGFRSRKELIEEGEHLYKIEGCWYCHTDQTRTLIQDVTLNGSDSYPAPPSSANEYIYQSVTFPGTKRNGPDISRVGIKRPSRDWHRGHFWSPKTASEGSIMPAFQHFFDYDPRGTGMNPTGVPNYKFEAIYQYLMTKGTRITPPTEAWWLGKDPVRTKEIIEGRKVLKP